MENLSEKIAMLTNIVADEAGKKRDELIAETEKIKKQRLEQLSADIREAADEELSKAVSRVKKENNEKILKTETDYKKQLLMKREDIVSRVMDSVTARLEDFIAGSEYGGWLKRKLDAALSEVGEGEKYALLTERDAAAYGAALGVDVHTAPDKELIGGLTVFNTDKHICVDYSFKTLLAAEKSRFLQTSGLNIG